MLVTNIHRLVWILAFTVGIVQILGWPSAIYKVGVPCSVILLLLYTVEKKYFLEKKRLKLPSFLYFSVFVFISLISKINNSIDNFSYLYFLSLCCIPFLYFIIIVNDDNLVRLRKIGKIIIFFYLLQLPAGLIKYVFVGQGENYQTTIAAYSGSLNVIFSLFGIVVLIAFYVYTAERKYLYLSAGFFLVAVIGEKRALVLFIPIAILVLSLLYLYKKGTIFSYGSLRFLSSVVLIGLLSFYLGVRLLPSLNPDDKIWGKFDVDYFFEYASFYTSSEGKTFEEMRRLDGFIYFTDYLYDRNMLTFVFGEGAGKLIESRYKKFSGEMRDVYGVRYGGRMAFIWLYLQVGILGVIFYILIFGKLARFIWKRYRAEPLYLAFIVLTFVYALDFFTYSKVFIRFMPLIGVYFYIAALLYHDSEKPGFIRALLNSKDSSFKSQSDGCEDNSLAKKNKKLPSRYKGRW